MSNRRQTSNTLIVFILIVEVFMYFLLPVYYNPQFHRIIMILSLLATTIFFRAQAFNDVRQQTFRPIILFLIGYFIVFFQYKIDLLFGIKDCNDPVFLSSNIILKSTLLSSLGLCSFYIGVLSVPIAKSVKSFRRHNDSRNAVVISKAIFLFSSFLWLIFNIKQCLSGTYSQSELENNAGSMSNYSTILFITSFFTYLTYIVYTNRITQDIDIKTFLKLFGFFPHICLFVYVLLTLNLGDRGPIIIVLSSYFSACLILTKKNISWVKLLLLLIISASVASLIGLARGMMGDNMYEKLKVLETRPDETCLPITSELAYSQVTLNYAIENIPENYDYFKGKFQIRQIFATIPFSSRVTKYFLDQDWKLRSSAFFITYLIQGENYTYGNGTSLIADLYMSFGVLGVISLLFFLGMIMRKNEINIFRSTNISLPHILLYICFSGYAVAESRSSLLSPLNFIAFSFILTYLIKSITKSNNA